MRWVFAVSLIAGMLALMGWVMLQGSRSREPNRPATKAQKVIAAAVAFGMGGLSASYGGWSLGLATLVAVGAGVLAGWYAGTRGSPGGEDIG
jgi:hypothetical protein